MVTSHRARSIPPELRDIIAVCITGRGCNFSGAQIDETTKLPSYLTGCNLSGLSLRGWVISDLTEANLTDAVLYGAKIRFCYGLESANVTNAKFCQLHGGLGSYVKSSSGGSVLEVVGLSNKGPISES